MKKKYHSQTIKKACRLREGGMSFRAIMKETGIKSSSSIRYACDPGYRELHDSLAAKWRERNKKRWSQIVTKAKGKKKSS